MSPEYLRLLLEPVLQYLETGLWTQVCQTVLFYSPYY
jgi:hypothetical protein